VEVNCVQAVVSEGGRQRGFPVAVALMRESHGRRRPPSIQKKIYKRSGNRLGYLVGRVGGLRSGKSSSLFFSSSVSFRFFYFLFSVFLSNSNFLFSFAGSELVI
jgi:hypothetical protein